MAIWIAVVPMPLDPPCTSSHSPGFKPAALEHIVPDGEEGLGQRGGLDHAGRAGPAGARSPARAVFGIAAAAHERADPVAELEARHAGAERYDLAGDLEPGMSEAPGGGG